VPGEAKRSCRKSRSALGGTKIARILSSENSVSAKISNEKAFEPTLMAILKSPNLALGLILQLQHRIERPMADIISGNIEASPIGPL
jgi:hypothetical protein